MRDRACRGGRARRGSGRGGGGGAASGLGGGAAGASRGRAGAQQADDRGVGRLGGEVRVPQASVALAGESAGDPGVQVSEVPDGDADAAVGGEAGADDVDVVGGLLLVARGGGREGREAHVDFGVGDLDAERREALEVGGLVREGGGLADDEVALESDAVNLDVAGLEGLDDVPGGGGFGARVLDVVVIVVQLDVGVVESSSLECDGDVLGSNLALLACSCEVSHGAYSVVEDINPVGTVVIESLIDHVPGIALALVMGDFTLDMFLQCSDERGVGPGAGRDLYALATDREGGA